MLDTWITSDDGHDYQPHRTDDPHVWGLLDVALRHRPDVPQTVYRTSGDSASGVMGLLRPDGTFLPKAGSRVGDTFVYQDGGADDGQRLPAGRRVAQPGERGNNAFLPTAAFLEVAWDGTATTPGEHSRGLLLGDYARFRDAADVLRLGLADTEPLSERTHEEYSIWANGIRGKAA